MVIIPKNPHNVKPIHKELIANHLLSGKSITQAKFCDMVSKSSRLAPRILDLKHDGYPIMKHMIKLDDGTHVAEYFLPRDFIQAVNRVGLYQALQVETGKKAILGGVEKPFYFETLLGGAK